MDAARRLTVDPRPIRAAFDPSRAPVVVLELRRLSNGPSPRTTPVDPKHVLLLAGLAGSLPPIVVLAEGLRVVDGLHRVQAALLRGDETIEAHLFHGGDDAAFLLALQCNIKHGLPLTLAERKSAAAQVLEVHPDWSDRAVARSTGLSDKTVAAIRRDSSAEVPRSSARLGADGRVRPLDGDRRRRLAAELIEAHPRSPLRQIAVAAGISVGTARDVRARVGRGEDPVPPRRRTAARGRAADPTRRAATRRPTLTVLHVRQRLHVLERLRRDPAMRFSASGRAAVRWLTTATAGLDRWTDLIDTIPPHWAEGVAEVAHGCARAWAEFATACEERARRPGQ